MRQPDEIGGAEKQVPFLIISDCDVTYARVRVAGAKVVIEFEISDYGGKALSCSDPKGHV